MPQIDETVHSQTLKLCKHAVRLSALIYGRAEHLATVFTDHGFECLSVITSVDLSAVCAFVRVDDEVFVVWRGTNATNKTQRRANAKTRLVPWNHSTGLVHEGLKFEWESIAVGGGTVGDRVMDLIAEHVANGQRIHLTGHSHGGGLGNLAAAALLSRARIETSKTWWPASLITFGSMRAGNRDFAYHVGELDKIYNVNAHRHGHVRFRNQNDVVTCLPSAVTSSLWSAFRYQTLDGYRHACPERYIWPDGDVSTNPMGLSKILQHFVAWAEGAWMDEIKDHGIGEYERHVLALEIPLTTTDDH